MGEDNSFSESTRGTPVRGSFSGPRSFLGVPQSQVLSQASGRMSFAGGRGGTPVLTVGYPILAGGSTPVLAGLVPQDRIPSSQDRTWVPPAGTGVPSPGQNSRASTCYVVSGMPLAFTQEDFLILLNFRSTVQTSIDTKYCQRRENNFVCKDLQI